MNTLVKRFDKKHYLFALFIVIVYAVAAFNLVGYYHPDEHYQILEFAQFKMGKLPAADMPWEFNYAMRSSFQPWIVIGIRDLTGITNPYTLTLILRLLTAGLAIYSIIRFTRTVRSEWKTPIYRLFLGLSFLLWFLPYLNVRFSSETWAGLFFLLACAVVVKTQKTSVTAALLVGILLGLSFWCRFQVATMILGLLLWLIIIKKERLKMILALISSGILVLVAGVVVDYFFYGYWTFSFWNYYNMNIVHDMASGFGTMDGFTFLIRTVEAMTIPVGIIVVGCFIFLLLYKPRSFVLWCMIPLIVVHMAIPHKEVRFLFPIANFIPYIIATGVSTMKDQVFKIWPKDRQRQVFPVISTIVLVVFALLNVACLAIAVSAPPQYGRIEMTKYFHDRYPDEKIQLYGLRRSNPFKPYTVLNQSFYNMKNISFNTINNYDSLNVVAPLPSQSFFMIRSEDLNNQDVREYLAKENMKLAKASRPAWVTNILQQFDVANRDYLLYLK